MTEHACFNYPPCDLHPDPFDCADHSVVMTPVGWAIPIRDGGSSFRLINFCPFCGEKLADHKPPKRPKWRKKPDSNPI